MLFTNEIYGPVHQNEGKSLGKEVVFIRLAGCNLACSWCDTPYTWNWIGTKFVHPQKFDPKKESHPLTVEQVFERVRQLAPDTHAVVISGGEPMLQQRELVVLFALLKQAHYWIEIETNGTVEPSPALIHFVDQINCSPKLSNSGPDNPSHKRTVFHALKALAATNKTNFKFVVVGPEDVSEILELVECYQMKEVLLMAEGKTKEEQLARQGEVADLARQYGFSFTPRPHIIKDGDARGV